MTVKLKELQSRLWDAASALRGPVDPADFKTYVFPMLFWKWLSDTWEHEHKKVSDKYKSGLNAEIESDYHLFELPDGTQWDQVTSKTSKLGDAITKSFRRIEQANPQSLAGIFGNVDWANKERIPVPALRGLISAFNSFDLNPDNISHDILGQGYEYLLKNFADESGKKAGEFFTPREVVDLLVGILEPEPGESVYDPAAGSGGMLVGTINNLRAQEGKDHRELRLYAQEINLTTSSIARMNLFLHEIIDFKVYRGDTLREPKFKNKNGSLRQFDTVIANPPFSLKNWGEDKWRNDPRALCGVPPAKNGDYAFIQHMISSMKPETGRVGVVMPHGVLFRGGKEGKIRKCLLVDKDLLEAVIGLPPNLFYAAAIPACILVFRSEKSEVRKKHVLFVDGSARFTKGKNQNHMSKEDINVLIEAYKTGEDPDGDDRTNVRLVSHDEIADNNFDLNIGRYIKVATEETADLGTLILAYQEAREVRSAGEAAMIKMLAAAGIEGFDE